MQSNLYKQINDFLEVREPEQLLERLAAATRALGFEHFAMGHHVDLRGSPEDALRLTNYSPEWIEKSLAERYYANDPIHRASTRTATGFFWSEVETLIRLTDRDRRILELAREFGLGEGFTVPIHVPGEYRGTCSFGAQSLDRLSSDALPLATMIATYAFEAGRRLLRRSGTDPFATGVPVLTDRQRDTLVLIARGKGDAEIAQLLGISRATAHEHAENVRRAYGNAQRPFLIVRALLTGKSRTRKSSAARQPSI